MIRFLQTEGPFKKIVLSGLLLLICAAMVIALVPGIGNNDTLSKAGRVAKVNGEEITAEASAADGAPDGATAGAAVRREGFDADAFSDRAGYAASRRPIDRQAGVAGGSAAHGVESDAAGSEGRTAARPLCRNFLSGGKLHWPGGVRGTAAAAQSDSCDVSKTVWARRS